MADYISREAAFDAVRKVHNPNTARAVMSVVALRELPAADVVEVKHGEWIEEFATDTQTGNKLYYGCRCSECGAKYGSKDYSYCFMCGARMKGE